MGICSNCLRKKTEEQLFCPWCGYPGWNIGLKRCNKGHLMFETFKTCIFCLQEGNLGKSFLDSNRQASYPTEVVRGPLPDKTVLETAPGATIPEDDGLGKTVLESDIAAVVLEAYDDKTRLDGGEPESEIPPSKEAPPFFAWLVFTDEDDLPVHHYRLPKERCIIGKSVEADIRLTDDFVSKLHTLIYFDPEKEQFYISDLASTNGTFLNDHVVIKEELKDNDRIRIGHKPMIFKRVMRKI
jgi:hypothetical protein